jgi:hypothetical protein
MAERRIIMLRVTCDQETRTFDLLRYEGQDYNPHEWALTVAVVEDTTEVYLVPLRGENGRLCIEELHNYLNFIGSPWRKTHTVYRRLGADFTNPNYR